MAEPRLTIFMLLKTRPAWLALPPADRFAFLDTTIRPILREAKGVALRFFDAEAFSARTSDLAMWEVEEIGVWQKLVDRLRETAFWDTYFEVVEILPAIENAYARSYGVAPVTAG